MLTRRARRRMLGLLAITVALVAAIGIAWLTRQSLKQSRAQELRVTGLAAAEAGEWRKALDDLSYVVAQNNEDLEALLAFSEVRSRVPEVNNNHLRTAMSYYSRACELAEAQDASDELRRRALGGRARMELANRAMVRLQETAAEILEIDPTDPDALEYMLQLAKIQGRYLPENLSLVIRGERSNAAWLEALRAAESQEALRWALEKQVLDPAALRQRESILEVLRSGGSDDFQRRRSGLVEERTTDLAALWAEESDFDAQSSLLLAMELFRAGNEDEARATLAGVTSSLLETIERARKLSGEGKREEAREVLAASTNSGIETPELALYAVQIYQNLGSVEDRARAETLLSWAETAEVVDPRVAGDIAFRHWNAGRSQRAIEVLERARETEDVKLEVTIRMVEMLIAILDARPDAVERIEACDQILVSETLDPDMRDGALQVLELARIASATEVTSADIESAATVAASNPSNPLVQAVYGDILERGGLMSLANIAWRQSSEAMGHASNPVGRRLIRGLLVNQEIEESFSASVKLLAATRSMEAATAVARSWLELERAGIRARDVVPGFEGFETADAFIAAVWEDLVARGQNPQFFLPILAESQSRAGDLEGVERSVRLAIDQGDSFPAVIQLMDFAMMIDSALALELCDRLDALADNETRMDQAAVARASVLRRDGRNEEAVALVRNRFADRTDAGARRRLAFEALDEATQADEGVSEAIAQVVEVAENAQVLLRMQRLAMEREDRPLALAITERIGTVFGLDATPTIAAEAQFTLGFESEDPKSVRNAILRVDNAVSTDRADPALEWLYVQLLQRESPPPNALIIERLEEMVLKRPGRFEALLMLIDKLQEEGRFEEAGDLADSLYRRRASAPVAIQKAVPRIMMRFGEDEAVVASACEVAELTGDPFDRILCINALDEVGDRAEANAMMSLLLSDPTRPSEADLLAAERLARSGSSDAAIELIRGSDRFEDAVDQNLALIGFLMSAERFGEIDVILDESRESAGSRPLFHFLEAQFLVRKEDPDPMAADRALKMALDRSGEDTALIRRIALFRLGVPELRGGAGDVLERLRDLDEDEWKIVNLAFLTASEDESFKPSPEQVQQAIGIVEEQPGQRSAWTLALEIVGSALREAVVNRETKLARQYEADLVEIASRAALRFPADSSLTDQLATIYANQGRFDDAIAAARESISRAGRAPRLGNVLTLATLQASLDRPEATLTTLRPFMAEIAADPDRRPRAWQLSIFSLLKTGRTEDAWRLFRLAKNGNDARFSVRWLTYLEEGTPAAILEGLELLRATPGSNVDPVAVVGLLVNSYLRTNDTRLQEAGMLEIDRLLDQEDVDLGVRLRLEVAAGGFDDDQSSGRQAERYEEILDLIPESLLDDLMRMPDLPPEQQQSMQPVYLPVIMVMNNFAALVAKDAVSGDPADDGERRRRLGRAVSVADGLGILVPDAAEVLDTRAQVALAAENNGRAVDLARLAVMKAPNRPGIRFTLARALDANGNKSDALVEARETLVRMQRTPRPDRDLIQEISAFIDARS